MSQQGISRATVERLLVELSGTTDAIHALALTGQIRLHSELAGLTEGDVAKVATPATAPAKSAKPRSGD